MRFYAGKDWHTMCSDLYDSLGTSNKVVRT
jgi:hypothetical protein